MNDEDDNTTSKKKIAYHSVDISSPEFDDAVAQLLKKKTKQLRIVDITPMDDVERERLMRIGDLFIGDIVAVHFYTTRLMLATYRDPVTRKKAGYVPEGQKRKRRFEYPNSTVDNETLSMHIELNRGTEPNMLRHIAFLAVPGTIEVFSGDYDLRSHLTKLARKEMFRFRLKRLRKPLEHLIQALAAPLPALVEELLKNGLPD